MTMDLADAASAIVVRTTMAQGLPFHVADGAVLARAAQLLAPHKEKATRANETPRVAEPAAIDADRPKHTRSHRRADASG